MDLEAYRKKLEERAELNRKAFMGQYKDELNALMGLSQETLAQITPEPTAAETYAQLITVVKEASAANIDQSELSGRIKALGDVAVQIASSVPKLAQLVI